MFNQYHPFLLLQLHILYKIQELHEWKHIWSYNSGTAKLVSFRNLGWNEGARECDPLALASVHEFKQHFIYICSKNQLGKETDRMNETLQSGVLPD